MLDLCKILRVNEMESFWMKQSKMGDWHEYYIKKNQLYRVYNDKDARVDVAINEVARSAISYKCPYKLNKKTRAFLACINRDYCWVARNKYNQLYFHTTKPTKDINGGYWGSPDFCEVEEELFNIDLTFIRWEDDEPVSLTDLLES